MWHLFIDILRNSILITGLVVVMMMMIESLNIESKGLVFNGLKKTKVGQVIIAALLGSIPGCMGGFATVSLYTHRMFSFGALVAMMIASSGDEAFVMLAMIPDQALVLFVILFILGITAGIGIDFVHEKIHKRHCGKESHHDCGTDTDCHDGYIVHDDDAQENGCHTGHPEDGGKTETRRHYGWKRMVMFVGLAVFIASLATGQLGHDHNVHQHDAHSAEVHHHCEHCHEGHVCTDAAGKDTLHIDLLNEDWMNILFAGLSVIILFVLMLASDHFVEGHLWDHIIKRHLPAIFAWTFGVLLVLGIVMQHLDIEHWISNNTALMILLAALIGLIPESGPHLIFVTMFAAGIVPFPVLLASSISQDGHASIPLLAESRKSFIQAKVLNLIIALAAGYICLLFI